MQETCPSVFHSALNKAEKGETRPMQSYSHITRLKLERFVQHNIISLAIKIFFTGFSKEYFLFFVF